jgi:hypothetical protein
MKAAASKKMKSMKKGVNEAITTITNTHLTLRVA